jgi:hypothetical protein
VGKSIVGIAGYKGAGKDTLADHLASKHGFVKASFAAPLKRALCVIFGFHMRDWESLEWKESPNSKCYGLTPRHLAQTLGTNWGRTHVNENVWVDAAMEDDLVTCNDRVVFSDVRFDNEAWVIKREGGVVLHLSKIGQSVNDTHASEVGIDEKLADYRIAAQPGSVQSLKDMADRWLQQKGLL